MRTVPQSAEIISPVDNNQVLKHLELCARNCYKSEGYITEDTTSAEKMIKKLIELDHTAMIEHFSVTARLVCDVGVYKDLTRHRMASFAIESTRYCNYSQDKFGNEITFIMPSHINDNPELFKVWEDTMQTIENNYNQMAEMGAKPDQLRMLLPHSTAATVIMTANIREWRHVFNLRCSSKAHPAVSEVMIMLLEKMYEAMPILFEDLYQKYVKKS